MEAAEGGRIGTSNQEDLEGVDGVCKARVLGDCFNAKVVEEQGGT